MSARTHGHKSGRRTTKEYRAWQSMRGRCRNPNDGAYHNYGGRGIKICKRWDSFINFFADMGPSPSPKHTVERRRNSGNYTPRNCYWATREDQANNKRSNRRITCGGITATLQQWSRMTGLKREAIADRLNRGMTPEKALRLPSGSFHAQRDVTHCKHGHPFDEKNTLYEKKRTGRIHRACRACKRAMSRRYHKQNREKVLARHAAWRAAKKAG